MTAPRVYHPLSELAEPGRLPLGDLLDEVLEHVWLAAPEYDAAVNEGIVGVFVDQEIALSLPGVSAVQLALGSSAGGVDFELRARLTAPQVFGVEVPLTLRIDGEILRPLKPGTGEPDLTKKYLDTALGTVKASVDTDGHFAFDITGTVSVPRCMLGSTGVIVGIGSLRWLTPNTDLTGAPNIAAHVPPDFTGLYLENVTVEVTSLPIQAGELTLDFGFIGTGGFTGVLDWSDPALTWNGSNFEHGLQGDLFGFKGALSKVKLGFHQNALTECDIQGNVFLPYLDRVIGLSLGFDGNGGLTAIAKTPTCHFTNAADAVAPGPSGYIVTAKTDAFTLDISRVEFHTTGGAPAALSLSGRAKLKVAAFDLPAVVFKGLRIDTQGNVAVEGGWLDVDTAKSSVLSGFPFQITKIGFGAETPRRRWIGLNGGIKLADGLPIGASVEGLRVIWDIDDSVHPVSFTLEGVGLELRVPDTFSFAGKVAFFSNTEATGFRGTLKLNLETVKLSLDAGLMIGRAADGTTFFFFYLDVGLPAGIPLFSTGAAIYGFAGLLATNLRPARADGEDWYYGYYKRPEVGVTDPAKWSIQRDAFAIGLGTTLGSLPDTGFAFSAKALLILVLPGPQLLLQGKGQFIRKKPDEKDPSAEGNFEALLVLDIPAKLFQANLAVAFKIPSLIAVDGGVGVAFSWSSSLPSDIWHVYLGEKTPSDRRIHATLFNLLKGDSWLMINRPGAWTALAGRKGDFEIGGSLGVNFKFDFSVVKAWLDAGLVGEAAISWDPQQFSASVTLKGSAGVSALGLSVVADLLADATVRAPNPWYLKIDIEVGIKINLLLVKWEFRTKLPLEFGDPDQPLPLPVSGYAALSADHANADEARALLGATVPPDVRPLVVFARPVQDRARFGSPGRDDLAPEDLGMIKVSYQLRHVVLLAQDSTGPRLVGAAGEATVSGTTITFTGLEGATDRLPDLAGTRITLFRPGVASVGPVTVTAGSGASANLAGSPPQGALSYRVTAAWPSLAVQVSSVGGAASGEAVLTIAGTIANPGRFRRGSLTANSVSWLVLEATATTIRVRVSDKVPSVGAATLLGPEPSALEGQWAPSGDPVEAAESSTRLQVWARTPFAFFRHNEQTSVAGLDAFKPRYACGPEAVEVPVCTQFQDVPAGPLAGAFSTAGVMGQAAGVVAAVAVGAGPARRLEVGSLTRGGAGTVVFTFDPPADAVWVTAVAQEAGRIAARRDGTITANVTLDRMPKDYQFSGGVDQIEIFGTPASVFGLCFQPGWLCVHFEAESFPQGRTGEVSYAGVTLASNGPMTVDGDMLEVDPPLPLIAELGSGATTGAVAKLQPASVAASSAQPMMAGAPPPGTVPSVTMLPVYGLVEPTLVQIPMLGTMQLVPGLKPIPDPLQPSLPDIGFLSSDLIAVEPGRDWYNMPGHNVIVETGRVWVGGNKTKLASVAVGFPRPVTRVRVTLGGGADVIAFAGTQEVTRGSGRAGTLVSLYANPAGPAHLGWIDRVVIIAPAQARVREICVDAGDLGWKRFEQWKWSKGVQKSVESLYQAGNVLPPGKYELRVHTVAVVSGAESREVRETSAATFTVGAPPAFPIATPTGTDPRAPQYPYAGPLTQLETYVERTMPAAGARLWYRSYDTAVEFNENYVTRMYLEAGHELRVTVVNASNVALRSATRHVWSGSDAARDAWTELYIRTLNGDGTDPCATVDLDRVVRPERVVAGAGELLEPARLHASQLRSAALPARVLHQFEFSTSRFASFRQHLATFDGRCRRLPTNAARVVPALPPGKHADLLAFGLSNLPSLIQGARDARAKANTGNATLVDEKAAAAALEALRTLRRDMEKYAATAFDSIWQACFGVQNLPELPGEVRLSVVEAATAAAGADVLLLESPEPIVWPRVRVSAAAAPNRPLRKITASVTPGFGRPDAGFEVEYGGIRWLAGVELWVVSGELRARADEPLDVTLVLEQATAVELVLRVDAAGEATVTPAPALPGGPVVEGPSANPVTVSITASAGALLRTVRVSGSGVGIISCSVTVPFVPAPPAGPLRITGIRLPTASQPLDHEITLLAMDHADLNGYSVRWTAAIAPAASEQYSPLPALILREGQRLRLVPARASAPPIDDALVHAGGPGTTPSGSGAVFQLIDPAGRVIHECAAMPGAAPATAGASLVAIPNADSTRAFLVPPLSARVLGPGHWVLGFEHLGDAGPDMEPWSIGGYPIKETATLRFTIL